jgi:hypothetical protein
MRKALKKLRYQAEFMTPLFDERAGKQFIRQLKALQDVFGYINDVRKTPAPGGNPARAPGRQRDGPSYVAGQMPRPHMFGAGRARPGEKLERSPRFCA